MYCMQKICFQLALESLEQTRTIQLLTSEELFRSKYSQSLDTHREITRLVWLFFSNTHRQISIPEGISFALAQCYMFISDMCGFAVGIHLIYEGLGKTDKIFM